jgi:hypothetical protein
LGMKKQLQAAVLHKSAQFISNVIKYASLIAEYPHSMWKVRQQGCGCVTSKDMINEILVMK